MKKNLADNSFALQIYTTEEADSCILALRKLQGEVYLKKKQTLSQILDTALPYTLANQLELVITKEQTDDPISPSQNASIEKLTAYIQQLPVVCLTLSFIPARCFLKACWEEISRMLNHSLLLEMTYDPSLIGGARIVYKGKYFDGSIQKKLTMLQAR